jgi:hypothetical protein
VSKFCQQAVQIVQRVSFPVYPSLAVQMEPSNATEEENIGFGFESEKADVEEEDKSEAESEEVELSVSDEEQEALTAEKSQAVIEDENEKSDSDLEVLEEIVVSAEVDLASAEDDEEEEEVTSGAEAKRIDDDVELLDEQPAKKARQEDVPEVSEPNEEVESMLADFVG